MAAWPFKGRRGNKQTTITSSMAETVIIPAYTEQDNTTPVSADVYCLIATNRSGSSCNVTIKDAVSGTTRFLFSIPAGDQRGFAVPKESAHQQTAGNNAWTAQCSASVDSIEITAMFEKNS